MAASEDYAEYADTATQVMQALIAKGDKRNYVRPDIRSTLAFAVAAFRAGADACRRLADETSGRGNG